MIIGRLRHKVIIKSLSQLPDSYGQRLSTWTTRATVWASIEPLRGNERLLAQQIGAEVDTRIVIRYLSGVVPTDRVWFGARIYHITSVLNRDERNEYMELMCKELV